MTARNELVVIPKVVSQPKADPPRAGGNLIYGHKTRYPIVTFGDNKKNCHLDECNEDRS